MKKGGVTELSIGNAKKNELFFGASRASVYLCPQKTIQKGKTMSKEALEHLRDHFLLTLSPMDINWLLNELSAKLQQQETFKPYTMDEINAMIDEGERQIANGEYYSTEQVMDMLAEELGLSDEEYLAASKKKRSELELEKAV